MAALRALKLLDTPPEERFDRITRLAIWMFNVPIAYLALVDFNRQWFKSSCGLEDRETDRSISFCGHTILQDDTLVIPDATQDPRFFDNPLVLNPPNIRFYMGYPLSGFEDQKVGTFCIADTQPRQVSEEDLRMFRDLAAIAERELMNVEIIDLNNQLAAATEEIQQKHVENLRLLLNILPAPIATRLKNGEETIADAFQEVTILIADIVGFTVFAGRLSATELVFLLNQLFSSFDELAQKHGIEKIKTMGDAYMAVGGLPDPRPDHAEAAAALALDMLAAMDRFNIQQGTALRLRIGLNTGPVVAGVIGKHKFLYDLWGDAVNLASRMQSHGLPDQIHLTTATYNRLSDAYSCLARGEIEIKGKGKMKTYLLEKQVLAQL